MAVYNGESYLREQLDSILLPLEENCYDFEVIIVDDCSSDRTLEIILSFDSPRIFLYRNDSNQGHAKSFQIAMTKASGQYIFLSDQDDVWVPGRVERMISKLQESNSGVLFSEFVCVDSDGHLIAGSVKKLHLFKSTLHNIVMILLGRANYWGCACLLNRSFMGLALPFPRLTESHDLWLGVCGSISGDIIHLHETTLHHRLHQKNVTTSGRRALNKVIRSRFILGFGIFTAFLRQIKVKMNLSCF